MALSHDPKWAAKADVATTRRATANGLQLEFKPPNDFNSMRVIERSAPQWAWDIINNVLAVAKGRYSSREIKGRYSSREIKAAHEAMWTTEKEAKSPVANDVVYDQYAAGEITRTQAKVILLRFGYDLGEIENNLGLLDEAASL